VFLILFVGLGLLFFLQKQHEKRAALEAKRRAEAASKQVAHTGASDMTNAQNAKRDTETSWVSYCEAATDFNVAQAYADAAETYAGSQPNALTRF